MILKITVIVPEQNPIFRRESVRQHEATLQWLIPERLEYGNMLRTGRGVYDQDRNRVAPTRAYCSNPKVPTCKNFEQEHKSNRITKVIPHVFLLFRFIFGVSQSIHLVSAMNQVNDQKLPFTDFSLTRGFRFLVIWGVKK